VTSTLATTGPFSSRVATGLGETVDRSWPPMRYIGITECHRGTGRLPKPLRRFLRFSVRGLLVLVAVCSVWLGIAFQRAREQARWRRWLFIGDAVKPPCRGPLGLGNELNWPRYPGLRRWAIECGAFSAKKRRVPHCTERRGGADNEAEPRGQCVTRRSLGTRRM